MNIEAYIKETYGVAGEHIFARDPETCVFRHKSNRKWFGVIMVIPKSRLGLPGTGNIRVINLKCDTRLIGSFRQETGIFPAWHMSKAHWLTVALDGTVSEDKLRFLLGMSFELTG